MAAGELLGRRARNRALLARQLLLERSPLPVLDAVEHLVGLQAQAPRPPYVGLWTRLATFDPRDLADLILERRVVRLALQRGTIHAVSARDALRLRPLMAPVFDRGRRQVALRLGGAPLEAVVQDARGLLEDSPLTLAELGRRPGARWPDAEPAALKAAARGALGLVQVPPRGVWGRGGPAAHTTIETWCGLTRLNRAAQDLRPRLRVFRDATGRELLDLPEAPRPAPDAPAPVRFLPEWDNILRSHQDRSHLISAGHRAALRRPNDVVPGTVFVDGFVAGTWRSVTRGRAATMHVEPFRTLDRQARSAVVAEGRRLLLWAAPDLASSSAEVLIDAPPGG